MSRYKKGDKVHIVANTKTVKAELVALIPANFDLSLSKDYKTIFGLNPYSQHRNIVDHQRYIAKSHDGQTDRYYLIADKHIYGRISK